MITNFEKITEDLTDAEFEIEAFVMSALRKHVDEKNAIKGPDLVYAINHNIATDYDPKKAKMTEVKLRKFVNYYRSNGFMPVCSTTKGYFISFENKVLESQVKSLTERANGIYIAAKGLKKWIK